MNELQTHLLTMLKAFISVCEKHHLHYFVNGGTCLGAIRHKGFIPWDDDIDVMMPRKDYDEFLKLQYEYNGTPYFIQTWQTDPHYIYCFAKLRDSNTTYIENFYVHHRINHGLWIDIFPIDGMSYVDKPREKCAGRIKFLWYLSHLSFLPQLTRKFQKETFFKDCWWNLVGGLTYIFDIFHFRQRWTEKICRHYELDKSVLAGCYFDYDTLHAAMDKTIYDDYVLADFEDIKVRVPKQYDKYLTMLYGDYMTPPPVEKQVGQHKNKGYSLTEGYKEYMKRNRI